MHSRARSVLIWGGGTLAVLLIASYSIFEARFLIAGPSLTIVSPRSGDTVSSSRIEVTGVAENVSDISLNDRAIFIDGKGNFKEVLLLSYGYNILTLKAHDRFGRETLEILELIYK